VNEIFPERLAEACRRLAARASDGETRAGLSETAAEYGARAQAPGLLAAAMFREERSGTFRDGYVFRAGPSLAHEPEDRSDWGYWRCDIAERDRLTWSADVHVMFGLPVGAAIDRDWAVGRYRAPSRATLQRVRDFALRRGLGFILDAEIAPENLGQLWIRILAVPVPDASGRVVRLHGMKRAL
jgi:hypothetical protein